MAGRTSTYSPELAESICTLISQGLSLRAIAKRKGMPTPGTVCEWLGRHASFADQYARAREAQCEFLASEIIDIADTCREGQKTERKEVGRECSKCRLRVRWQSVAWRHVDADSPLCDGAKAEKIVEEKVTMADMVDRSRLMVDARKWYLSKVAPKKYGDHQKIDMDVTSGGQSWAEILRARRAKRVQPEEKSE